MAETKVKNSKMKVEVKKEVKAKTVSKAVAAKTSVAAKSSKIVKAAKEVSTAKLSAPVFGLNGTKKGTVALSNEVFGAKINPVLMAQAVRVYLANQRQGNASTQTRGEVSLTTAKWFRQKGTGRARHGAKSAPIFVGGGIAGGPRPRDFSLKLSKPLKKKALFSALSQKLAEEKIFVLDAQDSTGKTKEMNVVFKTMGLLGTKTRTKILFVADSKKAVNASRNIKGVDQVASHTVNTFEILNNNFVVFEKEAIKRAEEVFLGVKKATEKVATK